MSVEIKLDRMDRVYLPGEKVKGTVIVHGKGQPLIHEGISLECDGSVNLHTAAKLEMQDATEEEAATLTVWMATGGHYQLRYEPSEHEGYAAGTAVLRAWHDQMLEMLSGDGLEERSKGSGAMVWQQSGVPRSRIWLPSDGARPKW